MRGLLLSAAAFAGFSAAAEAAPVTLSFDGVGAGTVISNQASGLTVSAMGGSGEAITFDTNNPTGGDADLGGPFTRVGPDLGSVPAENVLIISEDGDLADPDDNASGGTFSFDFDDVVTFIGFDGVDLTDAGANLIVRLFDAEDDDEIFSFDFGAELGLDVGDNEFFSFFANVFGSGVDGVGLAQIELTGSGAIDNLVFDPEVVPLPGAFALLFSGVAGLGFAMRRGRSRTA